MQLLFCPAAERRPEAQTGAGQPALLALTPQNHSILRGPRGEWSGDELFNPGGCVRGPRRKKFRWGKICNTREKKGGMRRGEAPLARKSRGTALAKTSCFSYRMGLAHVHYTLLYRGPVPPICRLRQAGENGPPNRGYALIVNTPTIASTTTQFI